jgi:N-methylhydantoinase B
MTMNSTVRTTLDPVTFAVIRSGLIAATEQGFSAMKRAAMLPLIYDGQDFSLSLYDDRMNLIAEAASVPLFAGALDSAVPSSVAGVGVANIRPGDVLVTTMPYLNGSHPPDAILTRPVFVEGRLIGYVGLRGHMGDLAAQSYYPTDSTEVFQEGLLLPPMKLYEEDVLDEKLIAIIRANSRLPKETAGDFLAGAAAVRTVSQAVRSLVERYGIDTYYATVDEILDHGERIAHQGIERIPDGLYVAEGALDHDGVDQETPVPLKVSVTIEGSTMTVDTTGSAAELASPFNCPWPYTRAVCRMIVKTLATPDIPSNSGEHRVLTVIAPEGTMWNSGPYAASYCSAATTQSLAELILLALSPALPAEIPAPSGGDEPGVLSLMRHPKTGRYGLAMLVSGAGFGARQGGDGPSALYARQAAGLRLVGAEVLEGRYPVLRRYCALDPDSGGPGCWRGGLGMLESQEYRAPGNVNILAERTSGVWPVTGLAGGSGPKRGNGVTIFPGTDKEIGPPYCKQSLVHVEPGDRYEAWSAGGGGFGDALERDVQSVAWDVKNEYVTHDGALRDYGVVIGEGGIPDQDATEAQRRKLRAARVAL